MSVTLEKILEFSNNCYTIETKNNDVINKLLNIKNTINNERFEAFNYDFLNLNEFINFPSNENVLYIPIESDDENKKILNAILSIINSNYITLNKHERNNLINEIKINYEEYIENNCFNLLILNINTEKIKWNDNNSQSTIILIKYNDYVMGLYNITNKHYITKSKCVNNFLNNLKEDEPLKECVEILTKTTEIYEKEKQNYTKPNKNKNKNKNNNNIFIKSDITEENKEINIEQLKVLINTAKITNTLGELQDICNKLNIDITKGLTKTNTPKYKTKMELLNEIKMYNI